MTYDEALEFIHGTLKFGSKLGLDSITQLLELLGNPHKNLKIIHVAGTNGKGTTTRFIAQILQEQGHRVGCYTSPYLVDFRERFSINGQNIKGDELAGYTAELAKLCPLMQRHPTEFEIVTAIAFMYFNQHKTDYVVLETGLGGRLDATNVVTPICSVITAIDFDHMEYLGNTIEDIAAEKAGIIKLNCPVALYPQLAPEALEVVLQRAEQLNAKVFMAEKSEIISQSLEGTLFRNGGHESLFTHIIGAHQTQNAATAIAAVKAAGLEDRQSVIKGIKNARWPGRFEVIQRHPMVIVDGAHNVAGVGAFCDAVRAHLAGKRIIFVMGILRDKQYKQCISLCAPLCHHLIACEPPNGRALAARELAQLASSHTQAIEIADPVQALEQAKKMADDNAVICVFGSLFLVGEILSKRKYAHIQTFGCLQNANDSEKLAGMLTKMGYSLTDNPESAHLIILNTCAIRDNAEKKVFGRLGYLKGLKKARPELIIALCGCMAELESVREYVKEKLRHVDLLFGTGSLQYFPQLLKAATIEKSTIFHNGPTDEIHEGLPMERKSKGRALVSIMYGCNNYCSYCIVPYVRGRERSRGFEEIVGEARDCVKNGAVELVLLGQNVNSYNDKGRTLASLLGELDKIEGIRRIRFMTSHPKDLTDHIIDQVAQCKHVCKAIHLPVQSGSDAVLQHMNRRVTKQQYLKLVSKIRDKIPNVALTTDIIVGYPTETQQDFAETMNLLEQVGFDMIFSFIYSPRKGTKAFGLTPLLTKAEISRNFSDMLQLQDEISSRINQRYVGQSLEVLIEDENTGRTESGKPVILNALPSLIGRLVNCRITRAASHVLYGTVE